MDGDAVPRVRPVVGALALVRALRVEPTEVGVLQRTDALPTTGGTHSPTQSHRPISAENPVLLS